MTCAPKLGADLVHEGRAPFCRDVANDGHRDVNRNQTAPHLRAEALAQHALALPKALHLDARNSRQRSERAAMNRREQGFDRHADLCGVCYAHMSAP